MSAIYIAIGANLGDIKTNLSALPEKLKTKGIKFIKRSSLWRNPAWPPDKGYPDYLNGVMEVAFDGAAHELLSCLQELETEAGRVRMARNSPRELDIDILDFHGEIMTSDMLTLPHPRLSYRAFVIVPLAEVSPNWVHPVTGQDISQLLGALEPSDFSSMRLEIRC